MWGVRGAYWCQKSQELIRVAFSSHSPLKAGGTPREKQKWTLMKGVQAEPDQHIRCGLKCMDKGNPGGSWLPLKVRMGLLK